MGNGKVVSIDVEPGERPAHDLVTFNPGGYLRRKA
jgi:hypothetical protein